MLVVDDTPANLSVLLDLLTGAGFAVLAANSGERALLQVGHRPPDLILLDAMMGGGPHGLPRQAPRHLFADT